MKAIKRILFGLLALVLALVTAIMCLWGNEIFTLMSFRQVRERNDAHLDGAVYMMNVQGGFYLEDLVAQGGVKSDDELIEFITSKVTKGLVPMEIVSTNIGCSSFTAVTEDGDRLFGRNYDFSKTNTVIVRTHGGRGRHASISTADLQFLGIDKNRGVSGVLDKVICLAAPFAPLDGVNAAGVSCGIYMSFQGGNRTVATDQNTDKPDVTTTTLLRLILDYADDVEEAVEIARSYDLHDSAGTSFHYMVADASGRSAILEWIGETDYADNDGAARSLVVHYNDADEYIGEWEAASDYQWVTNFIVNPGYYDRSPTGTKKGYDRYEKICQELNAVGGVVADEQAAMDILAMVGRRTWKNDDRNGCTVHSVVYNLTDKTALWVSNENYDDPTAVFRLSVGK